VITALGVQAVQGISLWKPDSLGPIYQRSPEDASLMVEVLQVLHSSESKFGASADLKLVERKVKKLAFMAQCLKDATWQKQHMKDARSKMKKKAALLATMSYAGQADEELLDSSRLGHIYKTPKYVFDPLMDGDFIIDADNYLEDFINASSIPKKLADRYTTSTTTTTTATTTNATSKVPTTVSTTVSTTVGTTVNPTVSTTAAKTTANPKVTTTAAKKMSLMGVGTSCTTRADPRSGSWQFQFGVNTAAPGTPCIFGVVPADEGSHCILSDGKYGSFGWCYTRPDRTEWGSCAEGCPLVGTEGVIAKRVDSLTYRLGVSLNKLGITKCY